MAKSKSELADWIQERVIAQAAELELTAYAIAQQTEGAVSEDHVRDYLTRRKSMGSHKLQHVLKVLGLKLICDVGWERPGDGSGVSCSRLRYKSRPSG